MTGFETREPDWLSFHDALRRVQSISRLPSGDRVQLDDALGLAITEEVVSGLTLPPGPTSHMDGYALRWGDISAPDDHGLSEPVRVVGVSRPGQPWPEALPSGSAIRIMTGALLPTGADTVVPVERTDREKDLPGSVRISNDPARGEQPFRVGHHVRDAGEELKKGERLAGPGETVTPGLLSLLAATGEPTVPVNRAPVVAVLVTGDELVPAGNPDSLAGGIRRADILSPSLPPLIRHCGGRPLEPRRVADDRGALEAALRDAANEADIILTTGGASMGDADLVKTVLAGMDFELDFWRVQMRPGSPVSLGHLRGQEGQDRVPVLGLPGNPVSALVTFLTLGLPAIRVLGGHACIFLPRIRVTTRETLGGPAKLTRFFRVQLDRGASGERGCRLSSSQGSGAIRSMASADGLAIVPAGVATLEKGDLVDVLLLPLAGWTRGL